MIIIVFCSDLNNRQTGIDGTKDVEIMLPLKYLSNFWRTLEIPLINGEVNLVCKLFLVTSTAVNQVPSFTITVRKLYVPVVTLSTQNNIKLVKQLESGFKRTINWNNYQSKMTTETQNWYLDFLIDLSFQEVNRLFVSSLKMKMIEEVTNNIIFQP